MSYRPSRTFLLCMIPLLATSAAGAWAWKKVNSLPSHVRGKNTLWEQLCYQEKKDKDLPFPTQEQIVRNRDKTLQLIARLTTEFPNLKIEEHSVPADQNGFLLLHKLSPPPETKTPTISAEFQDLLVNCHRVYLLTAFQCGRMMRPRRFTA